MVAAAGKKHSVKVIRLSLKPSEGCCAKARPSLAWSPKRPTPKEGSYVPRCCHHGSCDVCAVADHSHPLWEFLVAFDATAKPLPRKLLAPVIKVSQQATPVYTDTLRHPSACTATQPAARKIKTSFARLVKQVVSKQ